MIIAKYWHILYYDPQIPNAVVPRTRRIKVVATIQDMFYYWVSYRVSVDSRKGIEKHRSHYIDGTIKLAQILQLCQKFKNRI